MKPTAEQFVAAILILLFHSLAHGEHRVALLIGNSDYGRHKLNSPANDIRQVARSLEQLGFQTTTEENLKRDELKSAIERFASSVPTRGTALVYFAGYALAGEHDGRNDNFLLPVGEDYRNAREVGGKGYGLRQLLELLQQRSGSDANIVVVDGCYAWPNKLDDVPVGLIAMEDVGDNSLVCYAAQPGTVVEPAERVSPLADDFHNAVRSLHKMGGSLGAPEVRARNGRTAIYIHSTLSSGDCLDPQQATVAISSPHTLIEGTKAGDEWVNGQGTVFCWCPPGTFTMGTPPDAPQRNEDENCVEVTLIRGFWMGKYETTKRECVRLPRNAMATDKNHPIDYIHYDDFRNHLRTLNETERKAGRLPDGWEYTLPTEAQWEYACRAGSESAFCFGDAASGLVEFGNFADRSLRDARDDYYRYAHREWDDGAPRLAVVGSYRPNAWGLHDMHGNLWEVCGTRYSAKNIGGVDPQGDPKNGAWAARGGSWASWPTYCRSAFRHRFSSRDEEHFLGFRVVLQKQP